MCRCESKYQCGHFRCFLDLAFFGSRETRGFRLAKEANELGEKEGGVSISIEGKKMCFLEMLL